MSDEIELLKKEVKMLQDGNHALINALTRINQAALRQKPNDPGWKHVFAVLCDLDEVLKNLNKK